MAITENQTGFPDSSVGTESICNAGDPSLIPGSGRSAGEGIGYQLQYSCLENSMDCIVHGIAESDTTEQLALSNREIRQIPTDKPIVLSFFTLYYKVIP